MRRQRRARRFLRGCNDHRMFSRPESKIACSTRSLKILTSFVSLHFKVDGFDFDFHRVKTGNLPYYFRRKTPMSVIAKFTPTPADVERYRSLRSLAPDLNGRIVETVSREAMYEVADSLGILKKRKIVFRTEDETSILMDCCIYDWLTDGKKL